VIIFEHIGKKENVLKILSYVSLDFRSFSLLMLKELSYDYKYIGDNHFKLNGDYFEAAKYYNYAISCDPFNAILYCNRCLAYAKLRKSQYSKQAVIDAKTAISLSPSWYKGYYRLYKVYVQLQMWEHAFIVLNIAYDLFPEVQYFGLKQSYVETVLYFSSILIGFYLPKNIFTYAKSGNTYKLSKYLELYPQAINSKDKEGKTALYHAIDSGNVLTVKKNNGISS